MRSRSLISAVAFITAFAFSAAFAGLFIDKNAYQTKTNCFHYKIQTAAAITNFVQQDIRNGQKRESKLYGSLNEGFYPFTSWSIAEYAETVESYADDSGSMSYSHLPPDFQIKWREHMRAWRDYSNFLNRMKKHPHKLERERVHHLRYEYSREINKTWYEVLRVGRTYGAEVHY